MIDWRVKLFIYGAAMSAAYVELIGSLAARIDHPPLYWVTVASIIPLGALGIRLVYRSMPLLPHHEGDVEEKDREGLLF